MLSDFLTPGTWINYALVPATGVRNKSRGPQGGTGVNKQYGFASAAITLTFTTIAAIVKWKETI